MRNCATTPGSSWSAVKPPCPRNFTWCTALTVVEMFFSQEYTELVHSIDMEEGKFECLRVINQSLLQGHWEMKILILEHVWTAWLSVTHEEIAKARRLCVAHGDEIGPPTLLPPPSSHPNLSLCTPSDQTRSPPAECERRSSLRPTHPPLAPKPTLNPMPGPYPVSSQPPSPPTASKRSANLSASALLSSTRISHAPTTKI